MSDRKWLPISTAPRDGTMILVTETPNGEHWNVLPACWMSHGAENINPNSDKGDWWGIYPTHWNPSEGPLHVRWRSLAITPACWMPFPQAEDDSKLRRRMNGIFCRKDKTP